MVTRKSALEFHSLKLNCYQIYHLLAGTFFCQRWQEKVSPGGISESPKGLKSEISASFEYSLFGRRCFVITAEKQIRAKMWVKKHQE